MKQLGKLGVLKKRSEFLFVREGRYQARGGIVIQARENPESTRIRVGFTATKGDAQKALSSLAQMTKKNKTKNQSG